jgi:hypothetical protein
MCVGVLVRVCVCVCARVFAVFVSAKTQILVVHFVSPLELPNKQERVSISCVRVHLPHKRISRRSE